MSSSRAAALAREPGQRLDDGEEVEEPTVATYHSYAAGLLTEHGLRIGHEPDTRLIADASRYQLAGRRRSAGSTGPSTISPPGCRPPCSGCWRSTASCPSTS